MFSPAPRPIWWLPTFGFFLFLAIEMAMFSGTGRLFEDPAVGRHLRMGEIILATQQVPRADPLSYTYAGKPWVDFEWGFETTVGELNSVGGLALVDAFCTAIFAVTLLGVYRTIIQSGTSLMAGMLIVGVAFLTLYTHFSVRPVLFTYLFFALVMEVWYRRTQPKRRDWLFLPIIFVAWANLHAGWAAALAFLVLAIAGRALDRMSRRVTGEDGPLIPWIALTLLCAFAVSFNPWGWALYHHVFKVATGFKSVGLLDESGPLNFVTMGMPSIAVIFIVGVVILARLVRRAPAWRFETVVPILFFLVLGLRSQRHVLLLMLVALVPIARDLTSIFEGRAFPEMRDRLRQFAARQRLAQGDAWLAFIVAAIITLFFVQSVAGKHIAVGKSVTPQLADFMRAHPDRFTRPLVTTWNAGPLIWDLRPRFRTSFDDRFDFYGDDTVFKFVKIYNGDPGWQEAMAEGDYDSAILDPHLKLNQFLHLTTNWREVYRDEHAVVYWRDTSLPTAPTTAR